MLRRASLLIVLASGCDLVFGLDARDAGPDAEGTGGPEAGAPDAPHAPCVFTADRFVVPAYWWVPSADLQTAVRYSDNGVEYGSKEGMSAVQLGPQDYVPATVGPPPTHIQLEHPALSADGNQLVVRMERASGGYDIGIGDRFQKQFSQPQVVSVQDEAGVAIPLSIQHHPSAPTATTPRRMLLTSASSLDELVETTGEWKRSQQYTPFKLNISSVGTGNLSADGLSLVFEGIPAAGAQSRIYYMKRTSLDDPFTTPLELYNPVLSGNPYVSNDCSSLFFTGGGDARSAY